MVFEHISLLKQITHASILQTDDGIGKQKHALHIYYHVLT